MVEPTVDLLILFFLTARCVTFRAQNSGDCNSLSDSGGASLLNPFRCRVAAGPPPQGGTGPAQPGPAPHIGAGGEAQRRWCCRFLPLSCLFPRRRRLRSGLDRRAKAAAGWGERAGGRAGAAEAGGARRARGGAAGWAGDGAQRRGSAPRAASGSCSRRALSVSGCFRGSPWALSGFPAANPRCRWFHISPAGQELGLSFLSPRLLNREPASTGISRWKLRVGGMSPGLRAIPACWTAVVNTAPACADSEVRALETAYRYISCAFAALQSILVLFGNM